MIIKWKTTSWNSKIERVECTRETASTVVCTNGRSVWSARKMSEHAAYFDTWAEAHAYLLNHAERQLAGLSAQLAEAYTETAKIKQMTAPTSPGDAP